jgi:hypothetical protein
LPYVRDATDQRLRVHASRLEVPYITRDKQADVVALLKKRLIRGAIAVGPPIYVR